MTAAKKIGAKQLKKMAPYKNVCAGVGKCPILGILDITL